VEIFLETDRLQLRPFTEDDVDDLVELDGDPDVMHFVTGGRPTPREEVESEVLPAFLDYYARFAGYGFWAAIEKASGEFLGGSTSGLHKALPRTRPSSATGCASRPGGRAMRPKGSRALIDKGFAELGVRRVVAFTLAVHVASRRVMENAGLRYVRTFHQRWPDRIEGDEKGDVEYALLRSEWEAHARRDRPIRARSKRE
jgi:RimJ/RimL family protein N-acetyltransferase